jgi:uncharacterized protein
MVVHFGLQCLCSSIFIMGLFSAGCQQTSDGELLRRAATSGNAKEVERILASTPVAVDDVEPGNGIAAVELAVLSGDQATVLVLLKHGADVNRYDNFKMNPIYFALLNNDWPMIQLLREHGARLKDIRFKKTQMTPLMFVAVNDSKPRTERLRMIERLLASGVDKTARDADGLSVLDYARTDGFSDLVALLEQSTTQAATEP